MKLARQLIEQESDDDEDDAGTSTETQVRSAWT